MKLITRILLPFCLLLPITTFGETMDDLVNRDGHYYKEFTDVPFTGNITGENQGTIRNGKKVGPWVLYRDNGQLWMKGTYKDGKEEGLWVHYWDKGQLWMKGTYKDGEKEDDWVYYSRDGSVLEYGED
jgi:antitoxin component YwqK of YwqJK toxin-antitoxin module